MGKPKLFFTKIKRRFLSHVSLARILLILTALILTIIVLSGLFSILKKTPLGYYAQIAHAFLFTPKDKVKMTEGKTNILILGKGGEGHEAPDLTDTMFLASIDHKSTDVKLLSIPRDIWIKPLRIKLNSAYYWGNQKAEKGGLVLAKSTVEEIIGIQVHYAVVLDFILFKDLIDEVGGIQVDVERSFVDTKYPIAGKENDDCGGSDKHFLCRYETVEFKEGLQWMTADTALKFVRSRNAQGDEGTDFARAKRQQRIIIATKNKIVSREVLFSPSKLVNLKKLLETRIETDMDALASAVIARKFFDARNSLVTVNIPEDFLKVAPTSEDYDNLYVFIPASGDWSQIQSWAKETL